MEQWNAIRTLVQTLQGDTAVRSIFLKGKRQSNHTYSLLCSDEIMSPSWQGSDFFDPENQTRTVDRAHRGLPRQWPKPKSMV